MKRRRERVYEQAVEDLRTMIENGSVQPGDKLPPNPNLATNTKSVGPPCERQFAHWRQRTGGNSAG